MEKRLPTWKGGNMPDYLAEINEIMEEHQTIRGHVKLVGESIGDHSQQAVSMNLLMTNYSGRKRDGWSRHLKSILTLIQNSEG